MGHAGSAYEPTWLINATEEAGLFNWTEENVALLKQRWAEGNSASIIAEEMGGGVTRNAVIGKLHRLGESLARPLTKRKAPERRSMKPIVAPAKPVVAEEEFKDWPEQPEQHHLLPIRGGCKWPFGEVSDADFHYCNAPTENVYCTHHLRKSIARPSNAATRQKANFSYRTHSRYG